MDKNSMIAEIAALKNLLEQSDHVPNKLSEGLVLALDGATAINFVPRVLAFVVSALDEYRDTIKKRAAWRKMINDLEEQLEQMDEIAAREV